MGVHDGPLPLEERGLQHPLGHPQAPLRCVARRPLLAVVGLQNYVIHEQTGKAIEKRNASIKDNDDATRMQQEQLQEDKVALVEQEAEMEKLKIEIDIEKDNLKTNLYRNGHS